VVLKAKAKRRLWRTDSASADDKERGFPEISDVIVKQDIALVLKGQSCQSLVPKFSADQHPSSYHPATGRDQRHLLLVCSRGLVSRIEV
jgi:hypothetical protein